MKSITIIKETETLYLHLKKLGFALHEITMLSTLASSLNEIALEICETGNSKETDQDTKGYLGVVKSILDDHFLKPFPEYKLTFNPDPRGCPIQVFNLPSSFQNGWENDLVIYPLTDGEV